MKKKKTTLNGAAKSREYNSETLKRALDRRSAIKYQLKLVTDSLNYLENLQSEMEAKEVEGVEYSHEEWDCLGKKCGWEDRLLDSLEMDVNRSETELETVYSMMNESKNEQ